MAKVAPDPSRGTFVVEHTRFVGFANSWPTTSLFRFYTYYNPTFSSLTHPTITPLPHASKPNTL